jgi:uncharacterized protein (DUF4415 family)
MRRRHTPVSLRKGIKITDEIREAYERRDKTLDDDPDARPLPPAKWEHAMRRDEFFRPIKKPVTARIDADVLEWLRSQGTGHLTRINTLLREAMKRDLNKKLRRA